MRFVSVVLAALLLGLAVSGCQDPNSPAARPEMMFPGGGGGGGGGGGAAAGSGRLLVRDSASRWATGGLPEAARATAAAGSAPSRRRATNPKRPTPRRRRRS